jgi:hypothetical protein
MVGNWACTDRGSKRVRHKTARLEATPRNSVCRIAPTQQADLSVRALVVMTMLLNRA